MFGTRYDHLLMCLEERMPDWAIMRLTKDEAYERLKEISGQDFGYDAVKWIEWGLEKKLCAVYDEAYVIEIKKSHKLKCEDEA